MSHSNSNSDCNSDANSDDDSDINDVGLSSILPIQQQDVHRIVSGQVISDMASAVKELVDNALDASATTINIRLFNQGIDVIEVSDDGTGIPKHSRPLVAMKHATSKIISFDDLYKDVIIDGQMKPNQLGFRGEALFSLVQISQHLILCTRTEQEELAQQIQFHRDGYLDPKSVRDVARKVGTTVAVVKLFDKLPVRRADMIKRIKAQRAKLLKLMQAYAVLCVGVTFNVYDKMGPGYSKTEVKMSTTGKSTSIQETISSVFGSSFLSGLCVIRVDLSSIVEKVLINNNHDSDESIIQQLQQTKQLWRIEGMVSNAPNNINQRNHNNNVARDIQFFSVNGRPVDLPKISKVLADTWRNFESVVDSSSSKKRPACVLGIYLPNSMFDVNVAPDKREVFISNENEIYSLLQVELYKTWAMQTQGTFVANAAENKSSSSIRNCKKYSSFEQSQCSSNDFIKEVENRKRSFDMTVNDANIQAPVAQGRTVCATHPPRRMKRRNGFVHSFDNIGTATTDAYMTDEAISFQNHQNHSELSTGMNFDSKDSISKKGQQQPETDADGFQVPANRKAQRRHMDTTEQRLWQQTKLSFGSPGSKSQVEEINELQSIQNNNNTFSSPLPRSSEHSSITNNIQQEETISMPKQQQEQEQQGKDSIYYHDSSRQVSTLKIDRQSPLSNNNNNDILQSPSPSTIKVTPTSMEEIESPSSIASSSSSSSQEEPVPKQEQQKENQYQSDQIQQEEEGNDNEESQSLNEIVWNHFQNTSHVVAKAEAAYVEIQNQRKLLKERKSSRIKNENDENNSNSNQNTSNEKGNVVKLSKEDFLTMTIIGQFNHGFILTLCKKGNLWIMDQHACDEKYNFEKLLKETKIHEQILLKPLPLELSPSEENCILENMNIFERNGFKFEYDESKSPRNRLSLIALPHSGSGGDGRKAVQFGKEDVGALCAILGADGGSSNAVSGSGTGADGNGLMGNNAVRRHAGVGKIGIGSNGGNVSSSSSFCPGEIVHLPKSIAMFASRACRSSIMIGDALSQKQMEEVVKKMYKVLEPWTCAHGRPTIRHIRDLLDEFIQDERMSSLRVAGDIAALTQDQDQH